MRAVIYARYSSDNQSEASIDDQVRICRARAEREGWTITDVYADYAISGASAERPRFRNLITDLPAHHVLGDKGYDAKALREAITEQNAIAVIPPRKTSPQVACDYALYCERNLIERFFLAICRWNVLGCLLVHSPLHSSESQCAP